MTPPPLGTWDHARHVVIMQTPALEHRVLRTAFVFYAIASLGFWMVNGLSVAEEWHRDGNTGQWIKALTLEGTSTLVIVSLFIPVALYERRFPTAPEGWKISLPMHLLGSVLFSGVHILAMNGLRMAIWPLAFEAQYWPHNGPFGELLYEYRKDLLSYAMMLAILALVRSREDAWEQVQAARTDARQNHLITLRCGGREIRLPAAEILSASAAGNYVEVTTHSGTHLARMTLAALTRLLEDAHADPVQIHRSHLVIRSAIREIVPSGDGDAQLTLASGKTLPVSRAGRDRL